MELGNLKLRTKTGKIIEFNRKLADLSLHISSLPDLDDEIPVEPLDENALLFVKDFLEAHNYIEDTMTWKFPFENDKMVYLFFNFNIIILIRTYELCQGANKIDYQNNIFFFFCKII